MKKIEVNLHHSSREEQQLLVNYLESESCDYTDERNHIIINPHYSSRSEVKELITYLKNDSWDFKAK